MKRMTAGTGLAGVLMLALSGCIFSQAPNYEMNYYDLDRPQPVEQNCIAVGLFNNATPARQRMLYREAGGRMVPDEYNWWVQSPELMLARYLFNALPQQPDCDSDKLLHLRGVLTAFDIDLPGKYVELSVNYEFSRGTLLKSGTLSYREPFTEVTREAFVKAFSVCARKLSGELLKIGRTLAAAPDIQGK